MIPEGMRISVAMLGTYIETDLVYAINSITSQDYPNIELMISMNELDLPACAVIDTLNANRKENLKRVWLNTEKKTYPMQYHLQKISSQMRGDWLLCLWNGAALYASDSLRRCAEESVEGSLTMGLAVLYEDERGYIGEQKGGVLFPIQFVKSSSFWILDLEKDLEAQIKESFRYCEVLFIRSSVSTHLLDHKEYTQNILHQNLEHWMQQLEQGQLLLNAFAYGQLLHMQKQIIKEQILLDIDAWIQYLIVKQKNGKWGIKNSDKALICHLMRIKAILQKRYFAKIFLRRYIKKLPHASCRRAVMVVNEYHLWRSCFQSVYDCLQRHNYEVTIVYTRFVHSQISVDPDKMLEAWDHSGYDYVRCEDYDLSLQSPDVLFFCKPYDVADKKWCIREIEKVVRQIVYIPYNMASMRGDPESIRLMYHLPMHFLAWRQLVYHQNFSAQIDRYSYNSKNKLLIGHPKYDVRKEELTQEESSAYWQMIEQAEGKTILLWNSHFAVDLSDTEGVGTFLCFGIDFLKSIRHARDYFVIWRPHPMFWENLRGGGYEQAGYMNKYMHDAITAGKLYVDRGSSQWPAVFAADILISDASSLIESFFMLQKPVILTQRTQKETQMDSVIYKASSLHQLEQAVLDLIKNGDKLQETRKFWVEQNYFLPSDGQCVAERLAEELERELFVSSYIMP